MEIRWVVCAAASGLYAARAMLNGRELTDTPLAERLSPLVAQFESSADIWQVDPHGLIDHLTAASADSLSAREQARLAIRKTVGVAHEARILAQLTAWIAQVQAVFLEVRPNALHELELRSAPLREQWEARGPGLLARLSALVGAESLVEKADIVFVQPVTGGGGSAHAPQNRVCVEAVLANPIDALPEVVRLGWLLSQLQLDLPDIQGSLTRSRAMEVGSLAYLPAILTAANEVELTRPVDETLLLAVEHWRLPEIDSDALLAWWETFLHERLPWPTALHALDLMLPAKD